MSEIYLRKKYYDGEQIRRIVTEELDDYETIMRILGRFADEPSAEPKQDEESVLKFYYVESIDDYWVGQRLDRFYYADWHEGLGFVWSKSRYLPWGEHVVAPDTLWKEHTYPSEPKETPFTEWIVGFMKKYARPTGKWVGEADGYADGLPVYDMWYCSNCDYAVESDEMPTWNFCPNCGAKMEVEHADL